MPLKKIPIPFVVALITVIVFFLTKNPFTKQFSLQMTLVAFLGLMGYRYWKNKQAIAGTSPILDNTFMYLLTTFILLLIAATGWFFSPFFFLFYFLALGLGFMFNTLTASVFVITLALLFSFNIGEVDLAYDSMVIISILSIIPLGIYLKKQYLKLKEASKKIMILEDKQQKYRNTIDEVLANKLNNFTALMLEPINDIKQFTYMLQQKPGQAEVKTYADKIELAVEKSLRMVKQFESEATGKKFTSTEIK